MTAHPLVENAAAALVHGWDPIRYADLDDVERAFADSVLVSAAKLRSEEQIAYAQAIGAYVGNRVAEILARIMPR